MRLQTKSFTLRLPINLYRALQGNFESKGITKTFQVSEALKKYFNESK